MADDIPLTKRSITVESKEVRENDWNEQTFFPFQEDRERHQVKIDQHAASFPMLGIGALVGAVTLIALAGAILLVIQGPGKVVSDWTVHVHKTHRWVTIPKPAAWLSGILSGISVCFHIALSEGLNIAWWYHVRQENATVRDLHDIWGHGTSTWTVMKSGAKDFKNGIVSLSRRATNRNTQGQPYSQRKHFSYVALATLFVATIPLNGFLLQNAVVIHTFTASKNATINIPMLNGDNFGNTGQVSATADVGDGGITGWSTTLGQLSQKITMNSVPIADLGAFNTTCLGTCNATVRGLGFKIGCDKSEQHVSIPINTESSGDQSLNTMRVNGTDVFSVDITYDYAKSSRVTMRTLWKDKKACTGNFTTQTCTLDLATVEYPVVINAGITEATGSGGLRNTTVMTLDSDKLSGNSDEKVPKVIELIPNAIIEGSGTEFPMAGVAGLLAQTLNSSVNLRYSDSQPFYTIQTTGMFAQQQLASFGTFNSIAEYGDGQMCEGQFPENVTSAALDIAQSMMFQLGAYNWLSYYGTPSVGPNDVEGNTPHPIALQKFPQNQYRIVWPWFFGAMAVTTLVAAFITPTFWGYWRLERKTTMSPFETARAFHAPVLYQEDSTVKSEDLIKKVGDVLIHRDLHVVAGPRPSGARHGTTW